LPGKKKGEKKNPEARLRLSVHLSSRQFDERRRRGKKTRGGKRKEEEEEGSPGTGKLPECSPPPTGRAIDLRKKRDSDLTEKKKEKKGAFSIGLPL